MRTTLSFLVSILGIVILAFFGIRRLPIEKRVPITEYSLAYEKSLRTYTQDVTIQGEVVTFEFRLPESSPKMVPMDSVEVVKPSGRDWVSGIIWCTVFLIYTGYTVIILYSFGRDKFAKRRESADTRDTKYRIEMLASFAAGAVLVVLADDQQYSPIPRHSHAIHSQDGQDSEMRIPELEVEGLPGPVE